MTKWTACSLRVLSCQDPLKFFFCRYCKMLSPLSVLFFSPLAKGKHIFAVTDPWDPWHLLATKPKAPVSSTPSHPEAFAVVSDHKERSRFSCHTPATHDAASVRNACISTPDAQSQTQFQPHRGSSCAHSSDCPLTAGAILTTICCVSHHPCWCFNSEPCQKMIRRDILFPRYSG